MNQMVYESYGLTNHKIQLIENGSSLSIRGKKTKLFFEKDKNLGIIPCYQDNEITLEGLT